MFEFQKDQHDQAKYKVIRLPGDAKWQNDVLDFQSSIEQGAKTSLLHPESTFKINFQHTQHTNLFSFCNEQFLHIILLKNTTVISIIKIISDTNFKFYQVSQHSIVSINFFSQVKKHKNTRVDSEWTVTKKNISILSLLCGKLQGKSNDYVRQW